LNKNVALKIATLSLGAIISLWFITTILTGSGTGYRMNISGNVMGYNYGGGIHMGNGAYYAGNASYLITILIKILFAIFVLGLVGGIIVWVKDYLFTAEDKLKIRQTFTVNKSPVNVVVCSVCGKEQSHEWKVCPYCGKETVIEAQVVTEVVKENI
jgi:hypothetical protein